MKKDPILKTKRLVLTPMTDEETAALIAKTEEPELRAAYGEMLTGARNDPANRLWYLPWKICLKKEGTEIGDLCFKGPAQFHTVEIGYGIESEHWNQGYATEAADALISWAFSFDEVVWVEAEAAADNAASLRVLEKLKFLPDGEGEEGPRFAIEKPMTSWISVYLCLGVGCGCCFGVALDKPALGIPGGIVLGILIGSLLDHNAKKERNALREERAKRKNGQTA